jgi:hypothetical protein
MTSHEQQLFARAEVLDETAELAAAVAEVLVGASGAGVDPHAVISLRNAVRALDPAGGQPGYQAGSSADRRPGAGYGSDAEFLEAISDAEDIIRERRREVAGLQEQAAAALDAAGGDLEQASRDLDQAGADLEAGYAMPTGDPCDGCHSAKAAAIAAAEAAVAAAEGRIRDAERRVSICEDAAGILDPLAGRLEAALAALRRVPADLGEVYELVYEFVRSGGKLPVLARWIEGAPAGRDLRAPPPRPPERRRPAKDPRRPPHQMTESPGTTPITPGPSKADPLA